MVVDDRNGDVAGRLGEGQRCKPTLSTFLAYFNSEGHCLQNRVGSWESRHDKGITGAKGVSSEKKTVRGYDWLRDCGDASANGLRNFGHNNCSNPDDAGSDFTQSNRAGGDHSAHGTEAKVRRDPY